MHFSQSFAAKLTAGLLAVTGMIAPAFAVSGTVDAEGGLRLRNASSTDAAVLETIPDGSQIEVSGITESGWYQVSFQDTQGYVSTDYVVLSETGELPTVAEPVYGKVTEGPLNVRSAPSTPTVRRWTPSLLARSSPFWRPWTAGTRWKRAMCPRLCDHYRRGRGRLFRLRLRGGGSAMQYLGYPYCYGGSSPQRF